MTEPRASRLAAGQTQRQMAATLGVSYRCVQDWSNPKLTTTILPAMLRYYRHVMGLEQIPFRARVSDPPSQI